MGERKVLNKYYPPDWDPKKIPRMRLGKFRQYKVRLMAPFNMRCKTCGHYIYKSTKFLAIKETVSTETYLGLYIFRFYIKCPNCCAEITFKTDPKNTDYVCEHGATRNFEGWRASDQVGTVDDELLQDEAKEDGESNPMRALEQRTKDSRREMDILDALEDIKDLNARAANIDTDDIVAAMHQQKQKSTLTEEERLRQEEDKEIEKAFKSRRGKVIRRLPDEPDAAPSSAPLPPPSSAASSLAASPSAILLSGNDPTTSTSTTTSSSSSTKSNTSHNKEKNSDNAKGSRDSTGGKAPSEVEAERVDANQPLQSKRAKTVAAAWSEKKIGSLGGAKLSGLVRRSSSSSSSSSSTKAASHTPSAPAAPAATAKQQSLGLVDYDSDSSSDSD